MLSEPVICMTAPEVVEWTIQSPNWMVTWRLPQHLQGDCFQRQEMYGNVLGQYSLSSLVSWHWPADWTSWEDKQVISWQFCNLEPNVVLHILFCTWWLNLPGIAIAKRENRTWLRFVNLLGLFGCWNIFHRKPKTSFHPAQTLTHLKLCWRIC